MAVGRCGYRPDDEGWDRGWRPVINVFWVETQRDVSSLSTHTGEDCRLLSRANWQCMARAGATSAYSWRSGDGDLFRVLRGGANDFIPGGLRLAYRIRNTTGNRHAMYGFRVARALTPRTRFCARNANPYSA